MTSSIKFNTLSGSKGKVKISPSQGITIGYLGSDRHCEKCGTHVEDAEREIERSYGLEVLCGYKVFPYGHVSESVSEKFIDSGAPG